MDLPQLYQALLQLMLLAMAVRAVCYMEGAVLSMAAVLQTLALREYLSGPGLDYMTCVVKRMV